MKKVHLVPHVHWDREWYFSTEESRILLVNNMEEIMDMLENNPDYPYYLLDGQTSILEDYFAVKPENRERVKKLVQEGKLIIGPWYTQTDEMIVGGESIVRNLLYGLKDSEEFGAPMKIGYLPDSFGQSAQMPQILNGFDIKYSIFWRGTSERHGTDRTEFYWESEDGSNVLVQLLPLGYAIGKYLPEDEEELQKRMDKYFTVLDRGATSDHLLVPNGHDQMPIQKNIFTIMEKLHKLYPDREFFLSNYDQLFAGLEKNEALPTIQGEFLDGKYMRVHRSIYSSRMDIKAANTRIENKITNILEPLASTAYSLGFEYHHGLIELIWKEIMKNHAHDSIGSCCSDKVHREIMGRFFLAEEKTDQLIEFYKRKITDAVGTRRDEDRLTAFNLLPYERKEAFTTTVITKLSSFTLQDSQGREIPFEVMSKEEIDPGLIDRQIVHYGNYDPFFRYRIQLEDTLPAMGYQTYYVTDAEKPMENSFAETDKVETDFHTVTVNPNGTLKIVDKELQETFDQVLLLENGGDDGDEYDYSPLLDEEIIYSSHTKAEAKILQNDYEAQLTIDMKLEVPEDLASRKANKRDAFVDVSWQITIPKHKRMIKICANLNNQAKDHRLRTLIPAGIAADFSLADNQFGSIKRAVRDPAMDVWEEEKWSERPDAIYPMLSYAGISDDHCGVSVLTNSTREFEVIGENYDTIALTLFRSVGVLGKEELIRRPGRPSGIKLPTPDSQMIGKLSLNFAIVTHDGETTPTEIARMAKEYATPVETYNKIPHNAMKLNPSGIESPERHQLLEETSKSTTLSTLKKAENEERLVLRVYNANEQIVKGSFRVSEREEPVMAANLNEKPQQPLESKDGEIAFDVASNQVKTLLI
ncbi:mannosylglycerate hydrolase [Lentibacillus sediminis]|uniref:mannosylglycerate hydrolase n=1 Tax=Lentibacillus sediminis TaxID=1940529 RepID=UPI000C1C1DED|nr:mannosylglycerate hydrolase [Lentibacillus sediminis]